jgi:hypothetical protein
VRFSHRSEPEQGKISQDPETVKKNPGAETGSAHATAFDSKRDRWSTFDPQDAKLHHYSLDRSDLRHGSSSSSSSSSQSSSDLLLSSSALTGASLRFLNQRAKYLDDEG